MVAGESVDDMAFGHGSKERSLSPSRCVTGTRRCCCCAGRARRVRARRGPRTGAPSRRRAATRRVVRPARPPERRRCGRRRRLWTLASSSQSIPSRAHMASTICTHGARLGSPDARRRRVASKIVSLALRYQASASVRVDSSTTASGNSATRSDQHAAPGQSTMASKSPSSAFQSTVLPSHAACHVGTVSSASNTSAMWWQRPPNSCSSASFRECVPVRPTPAPTTRIVMSATLWAPGRRRARPSEGAKGMPMKELTFHRWYLPWVERWPNQPGYADLGGADAELRRAHRAGLPPGVGGGQGARRAAQRPGRGDGVEQHRVHGAVPRRLPGCVRAQPAQPAVRAQGARVRPRRLRAPRWSSSTSCSPASSTRCGGEAGIEKVVLIGEPIGDPPHDLRYEDLLAAGDDVEPVEPEEDDPCLLMYTGGTTGTAEGRAGRASGPRCSTPCTPGSRSRWRAATSACCMTPMFHAASMALRGHAAPGAGARAHHAVVRSGQGDRRHRGARRDHHRRCADDARHDAQPPRLRAGASSPRCGSSAYGASPMPGALLLEAAVAVPRARASPRATA